MLQRRLVVLRRGRLAADDRSARRRRRVHRFDDDRQGGDGRLGGNGEARPPRARRQVGERDPRRRRPRVDRSARRVVRLLQRRAELHPPVAAPRPALAASTSASSSQSAASARCPYGDPTDPDVFMGPLVSEAQRDRVEGYVEVGKADGARLLTGGSRAEDRGDGFFFEPTVFAEVDPGSRLAQEEIFGPVLSVIPYDDDADAIEIANGTVYGLAAYVSSGDTERAVGVARRLRSGMVGVNGGSFIGAELPFSGIRQSGIGREWVSTGSRSSSSRRRSASAASARDGDRRRAQPPLPASLGSARTDAGRPVRRRGAPRATGGGGHLDDGHLRSTHLVRRPRPRLASTGRASTTTSPRELARAHRGALAALGTVTPWRGDESPRRGRACRDGARARRVCRCRRATTAGTSTPCRRRSGSSSAGLEVPVFVHPGGTVVGQRADAHVPPREVCGRPLDTTVTLARFILTGVSERHPWHPAPLRSRRRRDLHDRRPARLRPRAARLRAARPVGRGRAARAAVGSRRASPPRHRHVRDCRAAPGARARRRGTARLRLRPPTRPADARAHARLRPRARSAGSGQEAVLGGNARALFALA